MSSNTCKSYTELKRDKKQRRLLPRQFLDAPLISDFILNSSNHRDKYLLGLFMFHTTDLSESVIQQLVRTPHVVIDRTGV